MNLLEIFRDRWQWASEQMIKFWWQSESQVQIRILILVRRVLEEVCTVALLLVNIVAVLAVCCNCLSVM